MKKIKLTLFLILLPLTLFAETIEFRADSMSGTVSEIDTYTRLEGNAFVKTDSIELFADKIEITGTNYRTIIAKGKISGSYNEAGLTFECDSLTYDRETEIAILKGNVKMVDTENEVDLKAEFVEYNQKTEVALIQIDVEIIKEDSICTSAYATYKKNIQILELNGSPKITQKDDIFTAHEIIFNLDTEEITLIGKVQGTVTDEGDSE